MHSKDAIDAAPIRVGPPLKDGHKDAVSALSLPAQFKPLLCSASLDGVVRVWDYSMRPPRCKLLLRGHERGVVGLAYSPPARLLFSVVTCNL